MPSKTSYIRASAECREAVSSVHFFVDYPDFGKSAGVGNIAPDCARYTADCIVGEAAQITEYDQVEAIGRGGRPGSPSGGHSALSLAWCWAPVPDCSCLSTTSVNHNLLSQIVVARER